MPNPDKPEPNRFEVKKIDHPVALPTVMADRSQLVQFIQSLSDNIIWLRSKESQRVRDSEVGGQRSEIGDRESESTNHEL